MRFCEKDCAQQVAECMTLIYKRGLTTSSGGNVSLKDEEGYIWMSPAVNGFSFGVIHRGLIKQMFKQLQFPKWIFMENHMDQKSLRVNG